MLDSTPHNYKNSNWSAFLGFSIFSSRVATTSDEVLVRSPSCGIWAIAGDMSNAFIEETHFNVHHRINADLSKAYVRDCLSGYHTSPECNVYKRREIPYLTRNNVSCPFNSSTMCLGSSNNALRLDSTLLDSNDDLGINSEQKDRIQYRKVTTCSPVLMHGYTKSGTNSYNGRGYNFTAAFCESHSCSKSATPENSRGAWPSWFWTILEITY